MKRTIKILILTIIFFLSTGMIAENSIPNIIHYNNKNSSIELLYDNVWGTIYNAETKQCDNTPTITGDGSKINPKKASAYHWIAVSQEMLDDNYRQDLLIYPQRTNRYKGKIKYGDTVWIESKYNEINGYWIVKDVKNIRYKNSIDFLQTKGDGTLYNNNPLWSGKFENIKIYKTIIN